MYYGVGVLLHLPGLWESDLVSQGVATRIRMFPVQIPLGDWPSLGTQPSYKALGDF